MSSSTNPWYFCPKSVPGAHLRLYCFPYAGGDWQAFKDWPEKLPEIELWMVRLPGRGARIKEEPLSRMLPLVNNLARYFPEEEHPGGQMKRERTYAFFGHSLGARLGFELIRSLRRRQKPLPSYLLVSGCPAPQLVQTNRPIHNLPKDVFLGELKRRNGTPAEVFAHPELLELLLPMLRADFAVFETALYTSEPPLPLPITAFGGREDPLVNPEALEAWSEQTQGLFSVSYFAGDHFFLRTSEAQLLEEIGRILKKGDSLGFREHR